MFSALHTSSKGAQALASQRGERRSTTMVARSSSVPMAQASEEMPRQVFSSPLYASSSSNGRRDQFMRSSAVQGVVHPSSAAPTVDWAAVKADILAVITDASVKGSGIGEKGPTLVRLSWHASGTYDKMSHTGGNRDGTIRFKEELMHGANAGLVNPVAWMEPVHAKHPGISYADLYTYAGVVAVEAMGGPKIGFNKGRVDTLDAADVTPDGRLPDADKGSPTSTAEGLRQVFGRMGFNDQEIVCLSGAHALGRCHEEYSGYVGPWQAAPTIFGNIYFVLLTKTKWVPDERMKKFQFKDPSGTLMMLPSDVVLTQDAEFNKHVEVYAKSRKTFYEDFAVAFQKLLELGTSNLVPIA